MGTECVAAGNSRPSLGAVFRELAAAWNRERALFLTGLSGFALGLAGLVVLTARGRLLAPPEDLVKLIAFNVALAIFVLTLAPLAPLAGLAPRFLNRWRAFQVVMALGSFAVVNLQTYRGIDPRFPQSGMFIDRLASILFGLLAIGGGVSFLLFTVRLFRRRANPGEESLLLGARYGAVTALVGFGTGLWMILNWGSRFGEAGDILPLHALGFHALQALPLLALLLDWGRIPFPAARRWIHLAGSAWLAACAALAWQVLLGRSLLDPSPAAVVALVLLIVWGLVAARAAHAWFR